MNVVSLLPVATLGERETASTGLLLETARRVRIAISSMQKIVVVDPEMELPEDQVPNAFVSTTCRANAPKARSVTCGILQFAETTKRENVKKRSRLRVYAC